MPASKWAEHGTMRRYRQGGCDDVRGGRAGNGSRCDPCKLAAREFRQGIRAGQANPPKGSNVASLDKRRRAKTAAAPANSASSTETTSKPTKFMGANETAVHQQLGVYRDEQPVRFEMALTAARILDDPERVSLHGTILRQLETVTEKLTGGRKTKSKGRLAAVQAMTARAR
jgi:hypothetical protein